MSVLPYVITITLAAGVGGTGVGGFLGILFNKKSAKTVSGLLSFAAGVMLAVVCLDLVPDAIENSRTTLVLTGTAFGFLLVFLLNDLTFRFHIIEKDEADISERRLFIGGIVTAVALALHNFPEGMVIGASFIRYGADYRFTLSQTAVAAVIGLHNIPEGMAMAVPLASGGMRKSAAAAITALAGAPTVLGALVGYFLGTLSPLWLSLSLSLASGAMLYVVFGELLPEAYSLNSSPLPVFCALGGILTGIFMVLA
ncbi:MAG: ZIP family metal transporter [Acutalibacteraceae bacterium]|nr:ZIP family metal transporter [Acutalibacteraceae bacterium]